MKYAEGFKEWMLDNNPEAMAYLEKVLRENNITNIAVEFKRGDSSQVVRLPLSGKITLRLSKMHMTANSVGSFAEYREVERWLCVRGVNPGFWPLWQWVILHELAHLKNFWIYEQKLKAFKSRHDTNIMTRPTKPCHDKRFKLTLRRLAEKYPPLYNPLTGGEQ